jgi:hypothetical protein
VLGLELSADPGEVAAREGHGGEYSVTFRRHGPWFEEGRGPGAGKETTRAICPALVPGARGTRECEERESERERPIRQGYGRIPSTIALLVGATHTWRILAHAPVDKAMDRVRLVALEECFTGRRDRQGGRASRRFMVK